MPKKYKYGLDDLNVSTLLKLWTHVIETGENRIDVNQVNLTLAERLRITQLRFHALVAKVRNDKGNHVRRTWLITKRGGDFLKGKIDVPRFVFTLNNEVVGHSEELISKRKFRILDNFAPAYEIEQGFLIKLPAISQPALNF